MEERVNKSKATPTSLKATLNVGVARNRKLKAELLRANLQQTRETSDYDDFFIASKEDADLQCENAENIIEAIKIYIKNNLHITEDMMEVKLRFVDE